VPYEYVQQGGAAAEGDEKVAAAVQHCGGGLAEGRRPVPAAFVVDPPPLPYPRGLGVFPDGAREPGRGSFGFGGGSPRPAVGGALLPDPRRVSPPVPILVCAETASRLKWGFFFPVE
jgi:hypothetical protein